MVSVLINIIQHGHYYLIILLIDPEAEKRDWHRCFPMNFAKFQGTTFFKTHPGNCFWIKFCKS